MKIKVTGTKTDFAVGEEIVCDSIPAHLVNKCVVIDDSELEVATPEPEPVKRGRPAKQAE